ncbi:MAG: phospholipase D-like domain-containing protein [Chloroflexota bacterium]
MLRLFTGRGSCGALVILLAIVAVFAAFVRQQDQSEWAAPTASTGAIQLYFTDPTSTHAQAYRGGPDEQLAQAIDAAQTSVDVAAYAFNLWSLRDALLAAHARGVRVRMVVESDNLLEPEVDDLVRAGIPVLGDRREPLMHHKFIVIDAQEVWTGSMNLTLGSAYVDHNNLLRLRSPEIAADFTREFEEMFVEDRFGALSLPDTPFPEAGLDGRTIEVLFSPDDGVAEAILAELRGARSSIDLMAYAFTSDDIAQALIERAGEGVRVRVVVEGRQAEATGAEYARLRQGGLQARVYRGQGLLHHKVIVIDQALVITGSYNYTRSAEEYNDEAVLILHDPELAAWFSAEFDRLYRDAE